MNENQNKKQNKKTNKELNKNKNFSQEIKFFIFSISAAIVEVVSYFILLNIFKVRIDIAQTISVILSVIYNFTVNRKYTFKSTNKIIPAMIKVSMFYMLFIPVTSVGSLALEALKVPAVFIKALSLILNGIGEFLWWKYIVFNEKLENKKEKEKKSKKENKIKKINK